LVDGDVMRKNIIEEKKDFEIKLQTETTRKLFVKIEVLDTKNNVINEISGSAVGGNYNIDSASAVRRTCSIQFNLEKGNLPNSNDSDFWINKRFKLYIGLERFDNGEIYWFKKGTYAIQDPSIDISISDKTISINGLDKMALHNGDISGQLEYAIIQDVVNEDNENVFVEDAVWALMKDGGEKNLLVSKTNLALPYKIESAIGDTRWDILNKYVELFYNYQAYYDLDGYFNFNTKPAYQSGSSQNDISEDIQNNIAIDFSEDTERYNNVSLSSIPHNLIISIKRNIAYSNIKNKIIVYGGTHDDGYQPSYEIVINDKNYPNSPYTIEKLEEVNADGSIIYRTYVVQDDVYVDSGDGGVLLMDNAVCNFTYAKGALIFSPTSLDDYNIIISADTEEKGISYDVIWDDITYSKLTPKQYYGNTYYVGNVYILERLMESGDYTEKDDTGEPFVFVYNGATFNIYTMDNSSKHTISFIYKDNETIMDNEIIHAYSINLCKNRAEQEVYLHQQATDTVSITCVPIYSLDVNEVIMLNDTASGAIGEYVVTNISCGLGAGDTMNITANKLW
jgi:hypothetical protein